MRYAPLALPRRRLLLPALALGGMLFLSALSGCLNSADKPDSARAPKPDTIKVVQLDSAPLQPFRGVIKPGTGKLTGKVFDADSGRGIPDAFVWIKGKKMCAVADSAGAYCIINIPPGKYTVKAKVLGCYITTKKNVEIRPDVTTVINLKIKEKIPGILDRPIMIGPSPRPGSGGNRH